MGKFQIQSTFSPRGDQIQAIKSLYENLAAGIPHQVLLGVTGSGKTFTMANVIQKAQRPTLVIAHNKTLAAQLYTEFKELFPGSAVEYFVSYYDYYQPEAYLPQTDTYIEKDSSINEEIERMRLSTTRAIFEQPDVIIVASVSCIYGLGSPEDFKEMTLPLETGFETDREAIIKRLVDLQYERGDFDFFRGKFRVRGDTVDIFPSYDNRIIRVEFFGDQIEKISVVEYPSGKVIEKLIGTIIYPASHFVTPQRKIELAVRSIRQELTDRLEELKRANKLVEAQRLNQRTLYDLEMLQEIGYCQGIENYSRHLSGRKAGDPPFTLMDYLPDNTLVIIDESHQSIPQIRGMYNGDRSRKQTLVEYGFRLPSALDNRPLKYEEFKNKVRQAIYISATPADYELELSQPYIVEQIIRPTGLLDPEIEIRPATNQVDDLLAEIRFRVQDAQRVLVTTLTKRMAEDLSRYYAELNIAVRYLHSEIHTLERIEIIRDLRLGKFDVLVGVNLLREGLDIPEVSLVAILDADKEGFLRSTGALIQTSGRAARNIHGKVILYADTITGSMEKAISETRRRRQIQEDYNQKNQITPESIQKNISSKFGRICEADYVTIKTKKESKIIPVTIRELEERMLQAARNLEFEEAARLRDQIFIQQKKNTPAS